MPHKIIATVLITMMSEIVLRELQRDEDKLGKYIALALTFLIGAYCIFALWLRY